MGWGGSAFVTFGFPLVLLKGELFYDGIFNSFQFKDKPVFHSAMHRIGFSPALGIRVHRFFHIYLGPTLYPLI